jgi:hypothetical protein
MFLVIMGGMKKEDNVAGVGVWKWKTLLPCYIE